MNFYILRFLIALAMCFFSINTWAYYYLQEDSQLAGYWSTVNSYTTLTPGVAQTNSSSGVLKVSFYPTANFVAYRTNGGETTNCLNSCTNGQFYSTPGIEFEQWTAGAALGMPSSFSLTNENGVTRTFYAVGTKGSSGLVIPDLSQYHNISEFGDHAATHLSPWIGSFQLPLDVPYIFHSRNGESYTFSMPLSVPVGTDAGTYTNKGEMVAKINYQYCGVGCNPNFIAGSYWINSYTPSISVTIPNVCSFSNSGLTIDYKSLSPREVQGKIGPLISTTLNCNSSVVSGILKLTSTSGSNWDSNVGTSVKVKDKLDAILKVNGQDASKGMSIPIGSPGGAVTLDITSILNANGNHPEPGPFSGNAILVFSPN